MSVTEDLTQYSFKDFKPKQHQIDALNFALSRPDYRCLISSATGTGKAMMKVMLGVFLIRKLNKVDKYIIVAPPKGKISIEADIKRFTNIDSYSITDLKTFLYFFKQNKQRMGLMTYEMKKKLTYQKGGKVFLLPEVEEIMLKNRVGFSFDEVHKVKSGSSLVYKCFSLLTEQATCVYGFTGTILMKSVDDIYHIASFIRPGLLGSYFSFTRNYIVYREIRIGMKTINVPAYLKNLDKLKDKLIPILFSYFPPVDVNFQQYKCDITQETRERYIQTAMGLLDDPNELMRNSEDDFFVSSDDDDENNVLSHSSRMVRLQYIVDEDPEKKALLLKVVKENLKDGCIVYVSYHHTLAILRELFTSQGFNFNEIHGKMTEKRVIKSLEWFTEDSSNKILIITDAASASLNLQSVNTLILYNCMYSIGAYFQLQGRIVRMNSKYNNFNIKNIIADDTIDLYKTNYVTSNKQVYTEIFGSQLKLPDTQASGSFNSYLLQELRNKFMWQAEKTFEKKDKQNSKNTAEAKKENKKSNTKKSNTSVIETNTPNTSNKMFWSPNKNRFN